MLTVKQKHLIKLKLNRGYSDNIIADQLSLKRNLVFKYRQSLLIAADEVFERRLDVWIFLLNRGKHINSIAEKYRVKPYSIRQMLWRERDFSFTALKRYLDAVYEERRSHLLEEDW
jgi:hypothetical protein